MRFGVAEAHGRAEIMEFNFYVERGAITYDAATGRYAMDFAAMPAAMAALANELLVQEATGDRARVEAWFKKYGTLSPRWPNPWRRCAACGWTSIRCRILDAGTALDVLCTCDVHTHTRRHG